MLFQFKHFALSLAGNNRDRKKCKKEKGAKGNEKYVVELAETNEKFKNYFNLEFLLSFKNY